MENKYLEKIAATFPGNIHQFGKDFAKGWKRSSTTSKVGLGMSGVGLTMSAANFHNSVGNRKENRERNALEEKSLGILERIAEKVNKPQKVVVKVQPSEQTKSANLNNVKHFTKATYQLAKDNPLATGLGIAGALDGAMKTTKKKNESSIRAGLRGIRNTAAGATGGIVLGKALELGYKTIKNKAGN